MENASIRQVGFSTRAVHAGKKADFSAVRPHVTPIYQTVNFDYRDTDEGLAIFAEQAKGYIYSRYSNPTVAVLNRIVSDLEEGEAALSFGSGMAAISSALLAVTQSGDHIVASSAIYGGTRELLQTYLPRLGIETTFVNITNPEEVKRALRKTTRVIYTEPLGNPTLAVAEVPALAELAKSAGAKLVVDNTFTPPGIFQPLKRGADVVIHSATKYLGGHGDLTGGVVVGAMDFIRRLQPVMQHFGGIISPFIAWLVIRGIRTLGVRLQRHCTNAMTIARFLAEHPKIERVYYPGLPSHPQHALAKRLFNGFGGMLSFEVKGGFEAGKVVMDSCRVCNFTVSLGEIDTLIIHPASTSHVTLSREERLAIGVSDGLIRLSVGIEDVEDVIADLEQALAKV